jgi:hypothetical protein
MIGYPYPEGDGIPFVKAIWMFCSFTENTVRTAPKMESRAQLGLVLLYRRLLTAVRSYGRHYTTVALKIIVPAILMRCRCAASSTPVVRIFESPPEGKPITAEILTGVP